MERESLKPWEQDAIERLRVVCHELHHASKRIQLAEMLASLSSEEGVLTYTCPDGYIRLANGRFDYDLRVLRERRR